jgi:competence protein ComEC
MNLKSLINQAPFLRLSLPLIAGIVLALEFRIPNTVLLAPILITFITAISFTATTKLSTHYGLRWIFGVSLHLFLLFTGIYITNQKESTSLQSPTVMASNEEYIGIIQDSPEERTKTVKCFITIYQVKNKRSISNCKETILAYFAKTPKALILQAGNLLVFRSTLAPIETSGNPYEFDYRKYLSNQGVHYSAYIGQYSWRCLESHQLGFLQQWAFTMQNKLSAIFARNGMRGDELGVASALITGNKAGLDDEIKQAYIGSGTMHILAVSGMHVALLYWVLNLLLSVLDRNKYLNILKLLLLLVAVWLYALITGLGGSILRASVMITFVIIGKATSEKIHIYNSLAASALFLLLVNPYNLIDIGFQLSYLAVISITVFYPLIYELLDADNWAIDQIWSLIACTLAAQLFTTPISLFYFHQFPNLFIISNLLMIPLSTLIMYFAMLLITCSGWDWLALILGKVFNWLVWLLNKIVLTIEQQPFALTKGIYPNAIEVIMFYILICFVAAYFVYKRAILLLLGLGIVVLLLTEIIWKDYHQLTTSQLVIYNEKGNTLVLFRNGKRNVWLASSINERTWAAITKTQEAQHSDGFQLFQIDSIMCRSRKKAMQINPELWIKGNFVQFGKKRIMIVDNLKPDSLVQRPTTDFLLLRNGKYDKRDKSKPLNTTLVIMDASNTDFVAKKMERKLTGMNINVHNTIESGAFNLSPLK